MTVHDIVKDFPATDAENMQQLVEENNQESSQDQSEQLQQALANENKEDDATSEETQ